MTPSPVPSPLTPQPAAPDPVLGVVHIDPGLAVLGILGETGADGVDHVVLAVASDVDVPAAYLQAFVPEPDFQSWSSTRGLEVPLHLQ